MRQDLLASVPAEQMNLGAGQVDGGRHERESVDPGHRAYHFGQAGPLTSTSCSEESTPSGSKPNENVRHACGSRSITRTRWPCWPCLADRVHGGRLGDATLLVGHRNHFDHRAIVGPFTGSPLRDVAGPERTYSSESSLLHGHVVDEVAKGDVYVDQVIAPQRPEALSDGRTGSFGTGVAVTCSQVAPVADWHVAV